MRTDRRTNTTVSWPGSFDVALRKDVSDLPPRTAALDPIGQERTVRSSPLFRSYLERAAEVSKDWSQRAIFFLKQPSRDRQGAVRHAGDTPRQRMLEQNYVSARPNRPPTAREWVRCPGPIKPPDAHPAGRTLVGESARFQSLCPVTPISSRLCRRPQTRDRPISSHFVPPALSQGPGERPAGGPVRHGKISIPCELFVPRSRLVR